MKKVVLVLGIVFLCSCTANEDVSNDSEVDSDGYTTTTLSSALSLKWRVVDETTLEAVMIGDPGSEGWIAVGFGTSAMNNSKIIVAQNGTDSSSILDATGNGHALDNNATTILDSSEINVSGTTITATFNVSLSDVNIVYGQSTGVIWAYKSVSQTVQSVSNIGKHQSRGITSITFE